MAIRCVAFSILVSTVPLLAQPPAGKDANGYSLEKESALGKQLAAEMRRRTTDLENTVVQEYVNRLGQKLAISIPGAKAPFTFSVISEDPCATMHEPAALPGGYVFVPAALFLAAQDEAELAGMLAHAMAHIVERHGTGRVTRGEVTKDASIPLIFMGGWGGSCTEGVAIPRGFVTARMNYEREADAMAIQIMAGAGFDPHALLRYTERVLSSTSSSTLPTHLPRDERIATITAAISKLPAAQYAASSDADFVAAREEVRLSVQAHRRTPPSLRRKLLE
jgi:predicted Zn-dependent protease